MKVKIDQDKCIGCGVCATTCPSGIKMVNGKAIVIDDSAECLKNASEVCPVNIIKIN